MHARTDDVVHNPFSKRSDKTSVARFVCMFLLREFAVESLLFVTEYEGLKQKFQDEIANLQIQGNQIELAFHIHIPTNLKLASNSATSLAECGKLLFEKYVASGSAPHEINVSAKARKQLEDMFDICNPISPLDELLMLQFFDECASEVGRLLLDSFSRFTT